MPTESDFLTADRLNAIAQINARLLWRGGTWIHRRKETITIIDETALRRQVSVDFTLPDSFDGLDLGPSVKEPPGGEPVYCPPLFVLPKAPSNLMAFDLQDEAGVSLPLMTRHDNGRISAETLVELARFVYERTNRSDLLKISLEDRLRRIAETDDPDSMGPLRLIGATEDDPDHSQLGSLCADGAFKWWLRTLGHSSIVVVPYRDPTVRRKIFRLSYQQPIAYALPVFGRLGWTDYRVAIDSSWIDARNFHLEAEAPAGTRITSATLVDDEAAPAVSDGGFLRRVHLYRRDAERAGAATTTLSLRVNGQGFVGGAMLASMLVTAAIAACLYYSQNIAKNPTSAPALLLLLPGLIASYVARPDQHALTTRLLSSARWLLLATGAIAYVCAAAVGLGGGAAKTGLALDHRTNVLNEVFLAGLATAGLFTLGLVTAWLLAKPWFRRVATLRWVSSAANAMRASRFTLSVRIPISARQAVAALEETRHKLLALAADNHEEGERTPNAIVDFRFGLCLSWRFETTVEETNESAMVNLVGDCFPRGWWAWPAVPVFLRREFWATRRRLDAWARAMTGEATSPPTRG